MFFSVTTASSTITLETLGEFQAISSPNYPMDYPIGVERTFIIHSPEDSHVKLIFWDLSIERNVLNGDRLIIYDGKKHNFSSSRRIHNQRWLVLLQHCFK